MRIHGSVADASSHGRLANAEVRLTLGGVFIGKLYTGVDGEFELQYALEAPSGQDLLCAVSKDGYEPTTATRTAVEHDVRLDIELAPDPPPTLSIRGTVTSAADGAPISEAQVVAALATNALGTFTTDASGQFTIPDVSAAALGQQVTFVIRHDRFASLKLVHVVSVSGLPIPVTLSPRQALKPECSSRPAWLALLATILVPLALSMINNKPFLPYMALTSILSAAGLLVHRRAKKCPVWTGFPNKTLFVLALASVATIASGAKDAELLFLLLLMGLAVGLLVYRFIRKIWRLVVGWLGRAFGEAG